MYVTNVFKQYNKKYFGTSICISVLLHNHNATVCVYIMPKFGNFGASSKTKIKYDKHSFTVTHNVWKFYTPDQNKIPME